MKKKPNPDYLEVHFHDARPNKMFPDWLTERVRFLHYNQSIACAACGRKARAFWTLLMAFKVNDFPTMTHQNPFNLVESERVFPPLTPVCQKHMMAPCMPFISPKKKSPIK